jgi:vacuolar-type H+-ATPase subunit I/STV1
MSSVYRLIASIENLIINPFIGLLFAVALIMFLWGLAQFIINAGSEEGRTTGKKHMIWGIVGMFIMVGAYAIVNILSNTLSMI